MSEKKFIIKAVGVPEFDSNLKIDTQLFIDESDRIMHHDEAKKYSCDGRTADAMEPAGPRERIFFNPHEVICGVVTCGGLCPGLNDVIRSITLTALLQYKIRRVIGFYYGFNGLAANPYRQPVELTTGSVAGIQHLGGTILGSSRGPQDPVEMVDTLTKYGINILFVIGGDGTFKGASAVVREIERRGLKISVIGVPKTIDNDIYGIENSFGFATAVEQARTAIAAAHEEAQAAYNGIGLVKLMGRDSGFIAVSASLANSDVNFCLIPEMDFSIQKFMSDLEKRLKAKHHAVIVVSEGAGQHFLEATGIKDESGNVRYADIGQFLKTTIKGHFSSKGQNVVVKYIDPSYMIRSCPSNAWDSTYCLMLGEMAVHAGMAGKTDMFVGYTNQHYMHVPFEYAVGRRKQVDPKGYHWQTIEAINKI